MRIVAVAAVVIAFVAGALLAGIIAAEGERDQEIARLKAERQEFQTQVAERQELLVATTSKLVEYIVYFYWQWYEKDGSCFGWGNMGDDLIPAIRFLAWLGDKTVLEERMAQVSDYFNRACLPDPKTASTLQRILEGW